MGGAYGTLNKNACEVLAGKPKGKTLLERLRRRLKDVDCNDLVQDRNK
jgi:hypothetical protein